MKIDIDSTSSEPLTGLSSLKELEQHLQELVTGLGLKWRERAGYRTVGNSPPMAAWINGVRCLNLLADSKGSVVAAEQDRVTEIDQGIHYNFHEDVSDQRLVELWLRLNYMDIVDGELVHVAHDIADSIKFVHGIKRREHNEDEKP